MNACFTRKVCCEVAAKIMQVGWNPSGGHREQDNRAQTIVK